jgi:hypothetical protein
MPAFVLALGADAPAAALSPAAMNLGSPSLFPAFPPGAASSRAGASAGWPESSAPRVGPTRARAGYRNVEVLEHGQRAHVRREIDPDQAPIVRRIFEACSAGQGLRRTAKRLNAADVPGPRGRSLAPTCIPGMLHRELYRGRVGWNKTKWIDRAGPR